MKKIISIICLFFLMKAHSQNVAINATGTAPADAAALDISALDKGLLIPRVALTSTSTFAPLTGTPVEGMVVYNTTVSSTFIKTYYIWRSNFWYRLNNVYAGTVVVGNISNGTGPFVPSLAGQGYFTSAQKAPCNSGDCITIDFPGFPGPFANYFVMTTLSSNFNPNTAGDNSTIANNNDLAPVLVYDKTFQRFRVYMQELGGTDTQDLQLEYVIFTYF